MLKIPKIDVLTLYRKMNFLRRHQKKRNGPPTFNKDSPDPKRRRTALIFPSHSKQRSESLAGTEKEDGNDLSERNKTESTDGKLSSYQKDEESEQSSDSEEVQNINTTKQKHSNDVLVSVCKRNYNINSLLTFVLL